MVALVGLYGEPLEGTALAAGDLAGRGRDAAAGGRARARGRARRRGRRRAAAARSRGGRAATSPRRAGTRRGRSPTTRPSRPRSTILGAPRAREALRAPRALTSPAPSSWPTRAPLEPEPAQARRPGRACSARSIAAPRRSRCRSGKPLAPGAVDGAPARPCSEPAAPRREGGDARGRRSERASTTSSRPRVIVWAPRRADRGNPSVWLLASARVG